MQLSGGKIFLADERGLSENGSCRRYSTFNFGEFYDEHKGPFGNLTAVNEEWLAAAQSLKVSAAEPSFLVVVPVTGELILKRNGQHLKNVGVEEIYSCALKENETLTLVNPYSQDAVNYLQLWISNNSFLFDDFAYSCAFDLVNSPDQLIPLFVETNRFEPFRLAIGRFLGRKEARYSLKNRNAKLFAFVISGVFEIEGRLLHEHDGLALWDIETADIEALSNNSVILLAELIR